jgi:hypothetical protein
MYFDGDATTLIQQLKAGRVVRVMERGSDLVVKRIHGINHATESVPWNLHCDCANVGCGYGSRGGGGDAFFLKHDNYGQ